MINLTNALNCISVMKEEGTYRGQRIGIIKKSAFGMAMSYEEGQVILFKDGGDGTLTVETPRSPEDLEKREGRNLIATIGTMIYVPKGYVEEIKGLDY